MDRAQLLKEIRDERALLEQALARVDDRKMTEPGVVGEWSIKDVLAHIAAWESTFRRWLETAARGERPEMPAPGLTWDDVDVFNERTYQENRRRPLEEVRAEFSASYLVTVAAVEALDEPTLIEPERNPLRPGTALWHFAAANTSEHYREHRESIESWLSASE